MEHILDLSDIDAIFESLRYSKKNIDSSDASYEIRKENLAKIEKVETKLRAIRAELKGKS